MIHIQGSLPCTDTHDVNGIIDRLNMSYVKHIVAYDPIFDFRYGFDVNLDFRDLWDIVYR